MAPKLALNALSTHITSVMIGTLYNQTVADEPLRTRAILPTALVKHYKLDLKLSGPDGVFPAEFSGRFVPAIKWADGTIQQESIPIVLALVELAGATELLGTSTQAKAQILQFMIQFNYELMVPATTMLGMVLKRIPADRKVYDEKDKLVGTFLDRIEAHLEGKEFLTGQLSIADLYGVTNLWRLFQLMYGSEWRAAHPNVARWFGRVTKQAQFNGFFDGFEAVDKFEPSF